MSKQIEVREADGYAVVTASGELDAYLGPQLSAALDRADGADRLVIDLARVAFMDSTTLGIVTRAVRARESNSGRGPRTRSSLVRVVLPRGVARRIFAITTLDRVLPISASREEALAELSATGTQR
jgi:anti-sigma B factor antagonist